MNDDVVWVTDPDKNKTDQGVKTITAGGVLLYETPHTSSGLAFFIWDGAAQVDYGLSRSDAERLAKFFIEKGVRGGFHN